MARPPRTKRNVNMFSEVYLKSFRIDIFKMCLLNHSKMCLLNHSKMCLLAGWHGSWYIKGSYER